MSLPPSPNPNPTDTEQLRPEDILIYADADDLLSIPTRGPNGVTLFKINEIVVAGETKRKRINVMSQHPTHVIELLPYTEDPNLIVERFPRYLAPRQSGLVEVAYTVPEGVITPPQANFGFEVFVLEQRETFI